MKLNVFKIGSRFGYIAYIDIETKNVVFLIYDTPHEGGTLFESHDGSESPEILDLIKSRDENLYNRIMNIKSGMETMTRYAWFDNNGIQMTISFEKYELEWACHKNIFEHYRRLGYTLQPVQDERRTLDL